MPLIVPPFSQLAGRGALDGSSGATVLQIYSIWTQGGSVSANEDGVRVVSIGNASLTIETT